MIFYKKGISMNFSTFKRIKVLISLLCVLMVLLSVFMTGSYINNHKQVKNEYLRGSRRISIQSADGVNLYLYDSAHDEDKNNAFICDKKEREAFFSLISQNNGDSIVKNIQKFENSKTKSDDEKEEVEFDDTDGVYEKKGNDGRYYIKLTIDSKLQVKAYEALCKANPQGGSLMVVNYKTGEILCAATALSIDPNNKPDKNNEVPESYYFKPQLSYKPGSVIKTLSVAAALEKNSKAANRFSYKCTGKNGKVSCTYGPYNGAHGSQDLSHALLNSCNCAITEFTTKNLSKEEYLSFIDKVGFLDKNNQITELKCRKGKIDLSGKNSGYDWAVNGQDEDMASPAAIMRWYCALANDGVSVSMHLFDDTTAKKTRLVSEDTADFIKKALEPKLSDNKKDSRNLKVKAWGKTGTAQLDGAKAHAWFACALEDENAPPICCIVMLQHGAEGANAQEVCVKFIKDNLLK